MAPVLVYRQFANTAGRRTTLENVGMAFASDRLSMSEEKWPRRRRADTADYSFRGKAGCGGRGVAGNDVGAWLRTTSCYTR